MAPSQTEHELEKVELPFFDSPFQIVSVEKVEKEGKWGNYVSGYSVCLLHTVNSHKYRVVLSRSDTLLGAILAHYHQGNKRIVFTLTEKGEIIANSVLEK